MRMMRVRWTGRLPRNDLGFVIRPNTGRSVAGYKPIEATDFCGPHRKLYHLDRNQGYRYDNEGTRRTMHEGRLIVKTGAGCRTKEMRLHLTPGKSMCMTQRAPYVVENTSSQTCQDLSANLTEAPVSTNDNLHIEDISLGTFKAIRIAGGANGVEVRLIGQIEVLPKLAW